MPSSALPRAVFGSAAALILLAAPLPAFADNCAGYGPGFMRAEGGSSCVQFDGHVRVDTNSTGSITNGVSSNNGMTAHRARPASLQTESANVGSADGGDMNRLRLRPGVMGYAGSMR